MIQSKPITRGMWRFEMQLSRIYTRAVFKEFEDKMKYCTAYKIENDSDGGQHDYLVCHTNDSKRIIWGQHKFKVHADKEKGCYTCECKEWEHTGTSAS